MLHFQHPEYLLVLVAAVLLFLAFGYVIRWKKKVAAKIGDASLVKDLISEFSLKKFRLKFILYLLAFVLCGIALAGLIRPDPSQKIVRRGSDLMIALDVSKSMLATDIKPDRLERAKQLIQKIIDQMPDEKIGLVIFAGRAYLQMPMTIDHEAAKMFVASASTDDVPVQGTVISDALRMCMASFDPKEKSYKSVLLISDGEDHDEEALTVARELAKMGIMVNTVGIGSPMGSPIPDEATGQYKVDEKGQTVISKLNEQELSSIANATHGSYQLYSDPDKIVKNLKSQLAGISTGEALSDSSYLSFFQYYWYFLLAALVLLVMEFLISEKRRKVKPIAMSLLLIIFFSLKVNAQSVREDIKNGNKYFQEKNYDKAEQQYNAALEKDSKSDVAGFNMGNTLYRKDRLEDATKYFDAVITNTTQNEIKQKAFYNKGVALQKSGKLPDCIMAYKNALLLNPNDEEARQNLQRALKQQQQQQQQNQQQKKNDQKQQNKDQQKNKQNPPPPQPQQNPARISQKDAVEKLKALMENEKQLQDKLHKSKASVPDKPSKDW